MKISVHIKPMVRNGFVMSRDIDKELDSDGGFEYWLEDVQNYKSPTAKKVDDNWDYHMQRAKARLGQIRMKCLDDVNKLVFGLVERLKAGEDEDKLLAEYMLKRDKLFMHLLANFDNDKKVVKMKTLC